MFHRFNCRTENCLGFFRFLICLSIHLTLFSGPYHLFLFSSTQKIFLFLDVFLCSVGSLTNMYHNVLLIFFNLYSENWSFKSLQEFPSCANNLPLNSGSAATDLSSFSCKGITFASQNCLSVIRN